MIHQSFRYELCDSNCISLLCGVDNANIHLLESLYSCQIVVRGDEFIYFSNDEAAFKTFKKHVTYLLDQCLERNNIDADFIRQSYLSFINEQDLSWQKEIVGFNSLGKPIHFKTRKQQMMARAINDNDLLFSIGSAGTGKTFLAVLMACNAYKKGDVKRIVLTRPAVEAGESLGFLPGDLKEKVDPYLMPLYDALYEILGQEKVETLIEKNIIEIIPLAYMRGRTLIDCFVILDEAQNTTAGQMLMFLTRLGNHTKMIVNGDITQIDLNISRQRSGLVAAKEKLNDVKGVAFVEFEKSDIVRHPLVEKIIERFNEN